MKTVLNEIIDTNTTGLCLFDLPTGYGKTTQVINYIVDSLNANNRRKIFFITNLKKNLPYGKLLEKISSDQKKKVLLLEPYNKTVIDNWNNVTIDERVKKTKEYNALNKDIVKYFEIKNEATIDINDKDEEANDRSRKFHLELLNQYQQKISTKTEVDFRNMLRDVFFFEMTFEEREKYVKNNEWIGTLYPTSKLEEYDVIFMTTAKFLVPIEPFYKRKYHLYNNDILNESIMFIDEFDSTKKPVMNKIIEDGLKSNMDVIKLFKQIYHTLVHNQLPEEFLLIEREDSKGNILQNQIIIKQLQDRFIKYHDLYHMSYLYKTIDFNNEKIFLFNTFKDIAVVKDSGTKGLYINTKAEDKVNEIVLEKRPKDKDNRLLIYMIANLNTNIEVFVNEVAKLSVNYNHYQNNLDSIVYTTIEQSTWSVLNMFELPKGVISVMYDMVINVINRNRSYKVYNDALDVSAGNKKEKFMRKGFKFTIIEDSVYHSLQSRSKLIMFSTTPEDLLLKMCSKGLVVGMSATASINTVVGNYDMKYLKKKMKKSFVTLTGRQIEVMKNRYYQMHDVYDDSVNIRTQIIDEKPSVGNIIKAKRIFSRYLPEDLFEKYQKLYSEKDDYYLVKLVEMGCLYNRLAKSKTMYSMICFFNSLPGPNKNLDSRVFYELVKDIKSVQGYKNISYTFLNSDDFDKDIDKIHKKLINGEKVIVFTTYNTVGTGKNIQYKLPMNKNILDNIPKLNKDDKEKDFDSIFLANPTYLVENLSPDTVNKEESLSRFLFQQQYLYYKDSSERNNISKNIVSGIRKMYYNEWSEKVIDVHKDKENQVAQLAIQAIGRICRTSNKNKDIEILMEYNVANAILSIKEQLIKRLHNKEFLRVLDQNLDKTILNEQEMSIRNKEVKNIIDDDAKHVRKSTDNIEEWKAIREFVLKNPTSNEVPEKFKKYYTSFDVSVNAYAYQERGRKKELKKLQLNNITSSYSYEVSAKHACLDRLTEIHFVGRYFDEHNYAKTFNYAKHIMLPSTYRQIYLGALGEAVGKALIEAGTNLKLQEIEVMEHYELFDYKYKNVYIDFKHWSSYSKNEEEGFEKVQRKLKRLPNGKAVIINIVKRGNHIHTYSKDKNILVVPCIVNFEKKIKGVHYDIDEIMRVKKFMLDSTSNDINQNGINGGNNE